MPYCFGCGIEKDMNALESYPFTEEDNLTHELIPPLMILDCQGPLLPDCPKGKSYCEFRMVVVCHTCFHNLSPDMWISKACWESINPKIPYDKLPMFNSKIKGLNDIGLLEPLS